MRALKKKKCRATAAVDCGNAFPSSSLPFSLSHKLTCSSFSGFLDTAVTSESWPSSSVTSVPAAEEQDASSPLPAAVDAVVEDVEHE